MPAKPRWLLSIPDAISQLENLDRTLLTRRDIERLFGVSKARAATLVQTFGAEKTGNQRTLPRTRLLQGRVGLDLRVERRRHRERPRAGESEDVVPEYRPLTSGTVSSRTGHQSVGRG